MPLVRRSSVVAMKFSDPSSCADAEGSDRDDPERLPPSLPRTSVLAHRAQRCVGGPAGKRRPFGHEESRDQDDKCHERHPERHHVEAREGHVFRADLNRKDEISESGKGRRREHEEHHDRAVHRHQRQVVLGRDDAARRFVSNRADDPGRPACRQKSRWYRISQERIIPVVSATRERSEVLPADHLVIETEDVLAPEALGRDEVMRCGGRVFGQ